MEEGNRGKVEREGRGDEMLNEQLRKRDTKMTRRREHKKEREQ